MFLDLAADPVLSRTKVRFRWLQPGVSTFAELRTPVAVAAATLATAALFAAVRRRVRRRVDRRFNRARYDAEATVAAFAARLKDAVDLDAVRDDLASVVRAALEPAHISIWTSQSDRSSRNPADSVTSDVAVEVGAARGGDDDSRITG